MGRHATRAPAYTLEGALVQLAALERQRPGQLASWLRAQRALHERPALRAVFVNVVELRRG